MNENWLYVASVIGALGGVYALVEKIFGGGNALATRFNNSEKEMKKEVAALEAHTAASISALRSEFISKLETHNDNMTVGINAITANIHAMQVGFAEFRATMAEGYMRRDSYEKAMEQFKVDFRSAISDFKKDIREDFAGVKSDISGLASAVEAARRDRQ